MGCDEYFDVLELNGEFREKYYANCGFKYFCCTQTRKPQMGKYDKVILNNASDVWSVRLHKALNMIDTPYVMLILDDFFFSKKVDEKKIIGYLDIMRKNNVGELRLIPEKKKCYDTICQENGEFGEYGKDNAFRIGFTVGIWKKEFLQKIVPKRCSVWEAERNGIEKSKKYNDRSWTIRENSLAFVHAIMSAGWTKDARKLFRRENIEKEKYRHRKNKPWYIYCKGIVYNVMTTIAPTFTMNLIRKLKIGRK